MQYAAVSIGVLLSDVVFSNICVEVEVIEEFGKDKWKQTGTVFHLIIKTKDLRNPEWRFSWEMY